jgi:hypothetical protein
MVVRTVLTFSLLVALTCMALAGPYGDLDRQLKSAKSPAARERILQSSPLIKQDSRMSALLNPKDADNDADSDSGPDAASQVVELRALAESAPPHSNLRSLATDIKRSPIYSDPGERESTNWLGRALDRLRNWRWQLPKSKGSDFNSGLFGEWIIYFAWIALASAVVIFLIYGLRRVDFAKLLKRKAKSTILDDEEPDRTLDEWLILADQLEREGRYREAVRSLYLACLLKIDESRIARFDRGQTNWEHLARIEASPRRPENLDFRKPTQAFDRIWYGYQVDGASDVDRFRGWYREIVDATRLAAA